MQRLTGGCIELGLAFGLPLAQHLDRVPVPGAHIVDDLVMAPAQDQEILERVAVRNVDAAARTGRYRGDDMRDLADEDRLAAVEDDHQLVALGRVAVSPAQHIQRPSDPFGDRPPRFNHALQPSPRRSSPRHPE